MIDVAQFLLIVVIMILTGLLVVIGIQVVNILKEFRKSLERINKILDDAGIISGSVAKPVADFSEFFEGVKGGFKIIEWISDFLRDKKKKKYPKEEEQKQEKKEEQKKEQEQKKEEKEEKEEKKEKVPSSRRRFFFKRGKKLG